MRAVLLVIAVILTGCHSPARNPSVAKVSSSVTRAEVLNTQSRARVSKAKDNINTAREAVIELSRSATKEQEKPLKVISIHLDESDRLLREELSENLILARSLKKAQDDLSRVLLEQDRLMADLEKARKQARGYLRLRLLLSAVAAAVAVWIAWRMIPPVIGPYKWWAILGAGTAVGALLFTLL